MHATLTYPTLPGGRFFTRSNVRGYCFGFNGKEKVDEVYGDANAYDFGARIYDPRLGRWLAVDPWAAKYPNQSCYSTNNNNPIIFIDPTGKGGILTKTSENTGTLEMRVVLYSDVVPEKQLDALKDNLKRQLKNIIPTSYVITDSEGKEIIVDVKITFVTMTHHEAEAEANANESVGNNYFYVGKLFKGDSYSNLGGFQSGNSGVFSLHSSVETQFHEILSTLGAYTEKGELHGHSGSPESILYGGEGVGLDGKPISTKAAQELYQQVLTPEDLQDASNRAKDGKYGENKPVIYTEETAKDAVK